MTMYVHRWGSGPEVVLVHGAVLGGREAWRAQRPLTERWTLLAPDRPGHGGTPAARTDFEPEAMMVATQLLDGPRHLVGMSYGGIVALYAAAVRPENVLSLTVIEPPCTGVARGVSEVDDYAAAVRDIVQNTGLTPAQALRRFFDVVGIPLPVEEPLPAVLEQGVRQLLDTRSPDEATPPLDVLRAAPFEILVVSGGHLPANEIICDTLAERTGGARAVCPGAGHLVPDTGLPFNKILEQHLTGR